MKIIKPYVEQISSPVNGVDFLKRIEQIGRVCYKSEEKITDESAPEFVARLIKNGHEAMIEHAENISMRFVCDRGVSHEIVRHRLFSFAQESTRYCNYGKDEHICFIQPCWFKSEHIGIFSWNDFIDHTENIEKNSCYETEMEWYGAMLNVEESYNLMIRDGWSPQEARSVLPNSLKTEIIVTGNLREWRHFFKLRTAKTAHPQMQEVAKMTFYILKEQIPIVFDDITF